jgi:hypothetical protein
MEPNMDPRDVKIRWSQHYSLSQVVVQRVVQEEVQHVDHDLTNDPMEEAKDLIAYIKSKL